MPSTLRGTLPHAQSGDLPGGEQLVEVGRVDDRDAERLGFLQSCDAPGASPTTTAYVFFETEPGDLPPRATIASSASSRL